MARVLSEHRIGALPVLDVDDRLVGVVSQFDLLARQADPVPAPARWWWGRRRRDEARRATGGTAGDVMTADPITVAPTATLPEAARLLTDNGIKRLPVVDERGALVGVVSRADLVRRFLRPDGEIRAAVVDDIIGHGLWADPSAVDATVQDGVVTLVGAVEQRSFAEIAERLTRRLDGVVDVVNQLTYAVDDGGVAGRPVHR